MTTHDPATAPAAAYLAQPHEVHRAVLLYSGGLDTSVMLKWVQDQYEAEVIALCVDLGQPEDDFDAIRQKALDLGAVASLVVDAREEFARDYVAPAIKANARYQGGYPPFTALGRPLLAIGALFQIFDFLAIVTEGALRGAGDTRWPFAVETALGWGFFVPLAYVLGVVLEGGLTGAWIGGLVYVCALALVLVRRFRSGAWKRIAI